MAWVPGSYMRLSSLCYWGFYVLLLKPCAPDPGGRQGGHYVVANCTGGCRYDSLLCDRCGLVDLFEPANTALLWSLVFKHLILLYMYLCILTVLAKFYDMCNPEILCHCLFHLLFTCTLSEMVNKRCPINRKNCTRTEAIFPVPFERINTSMRHVLR